MNKLTLGILLILFIFLYFGIGEFLYGLLARNQYDYSEEVLFRLAWPLALVVCALLCCVFLLDHIIEKPFGLFKDVGISVRKGLCEFFKKLRGKEE